MAGGYYRGWARYVPVAERRKKAERQLKKLRKNGQPVSPVTIEGRTIARTFWGKAWCDNLETYRDYENRLPRGRSYVRNGLVVDLQVSALVIKAMVSGSSVYNVTVTIKALAPTLWRSICADCAGGIDSLVELLQGRFSTGVMERICRQDRGLFPKPSEIRFSCTCPDGAYLCKHVAAVLYGVGARLDERPELLFRLRAVDENDLVTGLDEAMPFSSRPLDSGKVLETDDISALFGLDIEEPGDTIAVVGCGGIGLNAIQGARIAGAERVIAVDRLSDKLELSRVFGATDTVDASEVDAVGTILELTRGGVDHAIEAVGLKQTAEQCFNMLGVGGTATVIGMIPIGTTIELQGVALLAERKIQGSVMGSTRFRIDMPMYANLYLQGRLKLDELVSRTLRLDEINEGFEALRRGDVARSIINF